jgi:peptide/nickel transport system ATP-binding protein
VPDAAEPPLGCSFHPRCPRAYAPCGWESRDLRTLLEERWAQLSPEEFQRERAVIGGLDGLDAPSALALLPCASGRRPTEVAALLEEHRAANPDDPFWKGVVATEERRAGVAVRFHEGVDPVLGPVGDDTPPVEVACHLYRPDLG